MEVNTKTLHSKADSRYHIHILFENMDDSIVLFMREFEQYNVDTNGSIQFPEDLKQYHPRGPFKTCHYNVMVIQQDLGRTLNWIRKYRENHNIKHLTFFLHSQAYDDLESQIQVHRNGHVLFNEKKTFEEVENSDFWKIRAKYYR